MTLFGAEVVGVAPSGGQPCKMELGLKKVLGLDKFSPDWTSLDNFLKKYRQNVEKLLKKNQVFLSFDSNLNE